MSTIPCANCGKPADLVCGECGETPYCSDKCDEAHWKVHHLACRDTQKRRIDIQKRHTIANAPPLEVFDTLTSDGYVPHMTFPKFPFTGLYEPVEELLSGEHASHGDMIVRAGATLEACGVQMPIPLFAAGLGDRPERMCLANALRFANEYRTSDGTRLCRPVAGFMVYPISMRQRTGAGKFVDTFVGLKLVSHVLIEKINLDDPNGAKELLDITGSAEPEPFIRYPPHDHMLQMIVDKPAYIGSLLSTVHMTGGLMRAPGQSSALNVAFNDYVRKAQGVYHSTVNASFISAEAYTPIVSHISEIPFMWIKSEGTMTRIDADVLKSMIP